MKKILAAIFLGTLLLGGPALGQGAPQTVKICTPTSGTACPPVTASAPLPVTGSFSATLSGFTPNGNYGTLTATAATSASTAMPAGTSVAFQNTSTVDVSCVLSSGAATATTNKIVVRGGSTVFLTVGSNVNAACINQTGSASNVIVMAGGTGLGTNFGGGGGGGGGGAVTMASGAVASGAYSSGSIASGAFASGSVASGAMVDLGAQADSVCGSATGTCSMIALAKYLNSAVTSAIPAGTNLIGDVNLRQGGTALSTTNGAYFNQLQGNAVLSATNPSFSRPTDGTNARVFDPCEVVAHVTTPISISSAATSVIVAGTASKKTYICSMMLMSAGTTNVGIVQGSGTTCGTSTLGLIGGATAATGPNLTAQAGFVAGNGNFAIAGTTVNANDICLINGSAVQVSGYVVTATP